MIFGLQNPTVEYNKQELEVRASYNIVELSARLFLFIYLFIGMGINAYKVHRWNLVRHDNVFMPANCFINYYSKKLVIIDSLDFTASNTFNIIHMGSSSFSAKYDILGYLTVYLYRKMA